MANKEERAQKRPKQPRRASGKPHFNLLDGLIVILVLLCVCGVYFRYTAYDDLLHRVNKQDYVLSFEVQDLRYTTPNYVNVGDEVRLADDGAVLGRFMAGAESLTGALQITPATAYFTDAGGNVVEVSYPDGESRVDVSGRILCSGTLGADGFCLGGTRYLAPGSSLAVQTDFVSFTILITAINPYQA